MRTTTAITSAALLLALTACGPSEEEQALRDGFNCQDDESMEECGERNANEMMESAPEQPGFNSESTAVDPESDSDGSNPYTANEEFSYDQHSVLRDPDTGQDLGAFTIGYIDADYECDGSSAVAFEVEVNTVQESTPVTLSAEDFFILDDSGMPLDGVAPASCEATLEAPADDITTEVLVIDADVPTGRIAMMNEHLSGFWSF